MACHFRHECCVVSFCYIWVIIKFPLPFLCPRTLLLPVKTFLGHSPGHIYKTKCEIFLLTLRLIVVPRKIPVTVMFTDGASHGVISSSCILRVLAFYWRDDLC